ncbi:Peptidyl-prolyl cis-trans isomerase D [Raoultella terrigena]|uniref:Peptidyl-prolyl cis-trans isomerase D n=1 Tax=Raoultella terrigena TaxID=577 RepID=A0A4V6J2L8_RAOTE|nr:Peptidyl-prolyl cis-trans isomerase D [Raoultella terrigena]
MMDNLRTAANSVVLKIIFGIIIVSFILTGGEWLPDWRQQQLCRES